ncbi:MAG: hypothetical protein HY685_04845 [Chloroflexi bacterium]|nr:hypothetical protein [Chloroflexota bacterium]
MRWVACPVCGNFDTGHFGLEDLDKSLVLRKFLLSAAVREASDAGKKLTVTAETAPSLLAAFPPSITPLDQMDRALLYVAKRQERADEAISVDWNYDYPLAWARDGEEFRYLLSMLCKRGLLERERPGVDFGALRLTPEGWERLEQLRRVQRHSDQAFVAMWFSQDLDQVWEQGFKPALEETGFRPLRVDLLEYNDKIDDRIVAEIRRSGLLVADFTGNRGGVYFEAGLALGLGIPVIWTCKDSDIGEVHFDTRQYNYVVWAAPADLREKLANRIAATIPGRAIRNT